jgi:hypothetical protein
MTPLRRLALKHALLAATVSLSLAACAAPVTPPTNPSSQALKLVRAGGAASVNVYVVDRALEKVFEFDRHGVKVAEKSFRRQPPLDVVTDSQGHVYVLTDEKVGSHFTYAVHELSHGLGT